MNEEITRLLHALLDYAEDKGLVYAEDRAFTMNRLLELFRLDAPEGERPPRAVSPETATPILEPLAELGARAGLFSDSNEARDLFTARVMGVLTPHPGQVRERFALLREKLGAKAATDSFYKMCRDVDYIRVDRIAKNVEFTHPSPCGDLEITINLSKPEKDPRDIAAARSARQTGYPRCMLCVENPGYAGRIGFPARQNHRIVPVSLAGAPWYLQYSPYAYYPEHCIVLNKEHIPMKIDRGSFERLLDFVGQFPHYFVGSNADLPIVGGSILSHDHFQGGGHVFPMDRAGVRAKLTAPDPRVEAWVVDWPMTCVAIRSESREALIDLADRVLAAWRGWSDPACDVLAHTDAPHNTITPIARMEGGKYRLNLVLRNNRTTPEHPLGLFHPHADLHHIKKENIGLIEVMGLFILPGRLVSELRDLEDYLTGARPLDDEPAADSPLAKHYGWARELAAKYGTALAPAAAQEALRDGLAEKCAAVLRDAGVYKQTPEGDAGLMRFLESAGFRRG